MSHSIITTFNDLPKNDSLYEIVNNGINDNEVVQNGSVENYLIENASNYSVNEYAHKLSTKNLLSNPNTATDPEVLFKVQGAILDYGLQMSLTSALTRKAIGAVEGLLRS